jgi:hypothetical protein
MGEQRYGCVVAQWDKPDWYTSSLEEAKKLCEEVDARPPIPAEQWIVEKPFDSADYLDGPVSGIMTAEQYERWKKGKVDRPDETGKGRRS